MSTIIVSSAMPLRATGMVVTGITNPFDARVSMGDEIEMRGNVIEVQQTVETRIERLWSDETSPESESWSLFSPGVNREIV